MVNSVKTVQIKLNLDRMHVNKIIKKYIIEICVDLSEGKKKYLIICSFVFSAMLKPK